MANTLKIKRGAAATIPQGELAEPLFTTDTYDLYIGKGGALGNQRFQKYIASGTSSQFLKGDGSLDSTSYQTALTFSSPIVNTSGTISIPAASGSVDGYLTSANWTTFNDKEPAITAGTTSQYYRGDKTFQTLDTAAVPENGAIYFTEPRVRSTVLTGLNLSGGGTIAATDSILTAFGKVQNQISALVGGATYQGTWNANTNSPTLASGTGTKGYYYVVSVAGSTDLDGITDWKVGDWAIFNGTTWDKVDNTDAVSSVNGFTGAVDLGLDNISDVDLSSPTGSQLLRFNGTSSKWENWTPTYISGNQTITLSGDVSGSGATAITTTIGALKVTNAMLAGSIEASKLVGTDIATVGTITAGTWNGTTIAIANGGTGQTTKAAAFNALSPMTTLGDIIYGGASGAGTRLAGNTTTSKRFLIQTGDGTNSAAPSWGSIAAGDVPTLNQNTTGSAATLTTARTLTIGATGRTFDGSTDRTWTLADIGAAAALSGTINTIAYWDSASSIASLATATYPSLTELSYVKGVTSAIQTQIDARVQLTGDQTISGVKSFTDQIKVEGDGTSASAINFRIRSTSSVSGNGYSSINATTDRYNFYTGTGASTSKTFAFNYSSITDNTTRVYTMPNANGTLALTSDLSSYLPLSGGTLTGGLSGTTASFNSTIQSGGDYRFAFGFPTIKWDSGSLSFYSTAGALYPLTLGSNGEVIIGESGSSSPLVGVIRGSDGSGTNIAGGELRLMSGRGTGSAVGGDIVMQISPAGTSGSTGNAATAVFELGNSKVRFNRLTTNGFLKTSASNGTVTVDTTSYLPLTGGTLTGALSGTSATFSSSVTAANLYAVGTTPPLIRLNNSNSAITSGAVLGTLDFVGNDVNISGSERVGAKIEAIAANDWIATNNSSTDLVFYTHGNGTGTLLERMRIASTGAATFSSSVNINGERLTIGGTTNNAVINNIASVRINIDSDNSGTGESFMIGHNQEGIDNNNVLFKVQDNGNVGIGLTTVRERFEVAGLNGNIRLYGRSGIGENQIASNVYYNGSSWTRDNTSYGAASIILDATNGLLTFNTTSATSGYPTERMRITSGGNVLIGTTTDASTKLYVNGAGRFDGNLSVGTNASGSKFSVQGSGGATGVTLTLENGGGIAALNDPLGIINFYSNDPSVGASGVHGSISVRNEYNGNWDGTIGRQLTYMSFSTALAGVVSEKMRITSGGLVGIGSNSPNDQLEVAGNTASAFRVRINNANASGGETLIFTSGTTLKSWVEFNNSTSNFDVWQYTNNALRFGTNNTERMRITSGGTILINKTSENAYLTGHKSVQIDGASGSLFETSYNGTKGLRFGSSSDHSFVHDSRNNEMRFATNDLTRMVIQGDGLVTVGTTTTNRCTLIAGSGSNPRITVQGGAGSNTLGDAAYFGLVDNATTNGRRWYLQIDGSTQLGTWYNDGSTTTKVGYQTTGGTWTNSDLRRKENISLINYGLNEVLQLQPKSFNFKIDEKKKKYIGFIAQDVVDLIPEAVQSDIDGSDAYYAMNYDNLVPVLVNAIKELKLELDTIKNK